MPIRAADLVAEFRGDARNFERTSDQVQREILRLSGLDPDIEVDADTGAARSQIAHLSAQVSGLSALDPDINVDAETALAQAEIGRVGAVAEAVDAMTPSVVVSARSAKALADIGQVGAAAEVLDAMSPDIDVDANTAGALSKMAALRAGLTGLGDHARGTGRGIFNAIDGALGETAVRSRVHFGAIAVGFSGVAAAATIGIGAAGGFGLAIASGNEQAQISFETMLGSAEKASTFLTSLKDFAATTPFEFPELQTAASSLISAGVEANKVIPIMTSLGNATSGMGTGSEGVKRATVALQQMSAAGKITGEDLNQLRDAGIPVFDLLAAATGKSKEEVAGLAQAGKLGRAEMEQLFSALESGKGLERFNGLMEAQSASLSGIMSTIKDTVGQGLATAVQPAIPIIKDALGNANDLFGEFANNIGGVFSDILSALAPTIEPLLQLVAALGVAFEPVIGVFAQVAGAVAGALAPALTAMAPALGEIAGQFGEFLIALVPLLPAIVELAAAALPLLQVLIPVATTIAEALVPALTTLMGWLEPVAPVIAAVVGVFAAAGPVIGAVAAALGFILSPLGLVVGAIAAVIAIGAVLVNNWDTITAAATAAWTYVSGVVRGAVDWITGLLGRLVDALSDLASLGWEGWGRATRQAVDSVLGFIGSIPGRIGDFLSGLPGQLANLASSAWSAFSSAARGSVDSLYGFVRGIPGAIGGFLSSLPGLLVSLGRDMIQGLINGIRSMFGAVKDAVVSVVRGPVDFVKGFLKIGSPSKLFAGFGVNIAEGLAQGMVDGVRMVRSAAASLADSATMATPSVGIAMATTPPMAPPSMGPSAMTTPTGWGGPYYEVHFHGPVVGNQAGMRDLARKLADVSGGRSRVAGLD